MNTEISLEHLLDEIKLKLKRELEDQEVDFLSWMHIQHFLENQWGRTGNLNY